MAAPATIIKLGFASVIVPAILLGIGLVIVNVIPGCHCNEGTGCHGCGMNELLFSVLFLGMLGTFGALVILLPGSLILAVIVGIVSQKARERPGQKEF